MSVRQGREVFAQKSGRGSGWVREVYVAAVGLVLGVAVVVGQTEDLGRRMCGGVDAIPGAAVLFGCDR